MCISVLFERIESYNLSWVDMGKEFRQYLFKHSAHNYTNTAKCRNYKNSYNNFQNVSIGGRAIRHYLPAEYRSGQSR